MTMKLVKHRRYYTIAEFFYISDMSILNDIKKIHWECDLKIYLKNKLDTQEIVRKKNHGFKFDIKIDKHFF